MPDTFRCPKCGETYAPHWRADDGSALCRSCADRRDGRCRWADEHPDHFDQHPCSYATEEPGDPCRYCGEPVPMDPTKACPRCWLAFDGMALADIRAVFAADSDTREDEPVFDVRPNPGTTP